ncbi:MAG: hypothetical protein EA423_12265 [Phycisphaerales bacterium]|nr:MAG: hypothetical protein EA423_12265 [Phycisphaerales bacterium]
MRARTAALLAWGGLLCASASADPWLEQAPQDASLVVVFDRLISEDAADARAAMAKVLGAPGRLEQTRKAWARLAEALGVEEQELTESFFGGRSMLVVVEAEPEPVWALLAEVEGGLPRKMIRSLKAAPRDIREGVPVLSLERGRYIMAARRDRETGRGSMLIAPRGSEHLFDRLIPVLRTPSADASDRIVARVRTGRLTPDQDRLLELSASPGEGGWTGRFVVSPAGERAEPTTPRIVAARARTAEAEPAAREDRTQPSLPEDALLLLRGGRTPLSEAVFLAFAGVAMPETPADAPVSVLVAANAEAGTRVLLGVGQVRNAEHYDELLAGECGPDFQGLFPGAVRRVNATTSRRALAWAFTEHESGPSVLALRVGEHGAGTDRDLLSIRMATKRACPSEGMLLVLRSRSLGGLAEGGAMPAGASGAEALALFRSAELVRLELRPTENGAVDGLFLVKFGGDSQEP